MADFDDSQWAVLDPATLDQRRCSGKLCFNWHRLNLTVPEKIGNFSSAGSDVVFEIVVDDYAEIWVDCSFETAIERALERNQEGLPPEMIIRDHDAIYLLAERYHLAMDDPISEADNVYANDRRLLKTDSLKMV